MYNEWFGLRKDPFHLRPDPSFLFLTDQHREALTGLTFGILQRRGLVVLTGEVGTGKTTVLARILHFLPSSKLQYSKIVNPALTPAEFLEFALLEFGVTHIPSSKGRRLVALRDLIYEGREAGKVTALIVDEAQKLSPEVLDEIRILQNLEPAEDRFLQILLVGQPEFEDILNREDMRPLKQRVGARFTLAPLAPAEVGEYMRHRWLGAGGTELPFSREAIEDVTFASQRIPRLINSLCDNALLEALSQNSKRVLDSHVRKAAARLDLGELPCRETVIQPEPPAFQAASRPRSFWNRWISRHENA
jgi:general secretion pathway protein A